MPCGILATPLIRYDCCGLTHEMWAGVTRPPTAGSCCTGLKLATFGEGTGCLLRDPRLSLSFPFSWDSPVTPPLSALVPWAQTGPTSLHPLAPQTCCLSPAFFLASGGLGSSADDLLAMLGKSFLFCAPFPLSKTRAPLGTSKPRPVCREGHHVQPFHWVGQPRSCLLKGSGLEGTIIDRCANQAPDFTALQSRAEASEFSTLSTTLHFLVGGDDREGRGNGQEPRVQTLGLVSL